MKNSNILVLSLWVLAGLSFSVANIAGAKGDKVDICHITGNDGTGFVLNVSGNAVDAHLAHGDPAEFSVSGGICEEDSGPIAS